MMWVSRSWVLGVVVDAAVPGGSVLGAGCGIIGEAASSNSVGIIAINSGNSSNGGNGSSSSTVAIIKQ
jgi:hypothetical protein